MLQRSEGSRYSSVRVWIEGHLKGMMKTLERSLVKRKCWITCAIPSSVHEVWCLKFYTAQQYYLAQNNFIAIAIEMGKLILTMLFLTVWFDELHNTSWWIIFLIYPFYFTVYHTALCAYCLPLDFLREKLHVSKKPHCGVFEAMFLVWVIILKAQWRLWG